MEKSAILAADIKKLNMEAFARVAQWAVLDEIYLADAKISRVPLIAVPEEISLEHKCDTILLPYLKEGKILCNFQLAAFSSESPEKLVMKIEASFCNSYVHQGPWPYDDFDDMLEYILTICPISDAWPYWREFVQSMSTRMGFPAITVPLLEIRPKKSTAKKGNNQPAKKESTRRKKISA
ncbi:MAG: hypothetical protein ACLPOQ_04240 [Desulfobaccales bacterium]